MKKLIVFLLAVICAFGLIGCDQSETKETEPKQKLSIDQKYPEYFDVETTKGLEVYVWEGEGGVQYCGVLPGTNRNKTSNEISDLAKNGATVSEMKEILESYDIERNAVIIIPVKNASSDYEIDFDNFSKASESFWGSESAYDYIMFSDSLKYLFLPESQIKVRIPASGEKLLDRIDLDLLKKADQNVSQTLSAYESMPKPSLKVGSSLRLYATTNVEIDPPQPKTLEDGTVITSGCDIDHRHVFISETITK